MMVIDGVEMVDVREAAAIVGRTPETVRRWVWSGRLASVRHGNRLLLERSALADAAGRPVSSPRSFAQWVAELPVGEDGRSTGETRSAADLVLEDRAARSDRSEWADRAEEPARGGR